MNHVFDTRLIKFGVTGIVGMAIDFSITWFCKEKLRWNKYVSNSLGFSIAVVSNFLLNRYWTFEQSNHAFANQAIKFLLVSVTGLAINNLLLYLLVNKSKQNFYFLKLVIIGLVFFWNYFINAIFTFN